MSSTALQTLQSTVSWLSGLAFMTIIVIICLGLSKLIIWGSDSLWKLVSGLSRPSRFDPRQEILNIKSILWDYLKRRTRPASPLEIANQAVRRVRGVSLTRGIRLLDIGLLSYDGGTQPTVNRNEIIPAYITRLCPFLVINVAAKRNTHFTLKVVLVDSAEQVHFASEVRDHFRHGRNYCMPSSSLQISNSEMSGNWSMRVSVDEQPFAQHNFGVASDVGVGFRPYLHPDGEIDEWLAQSAASVPTENLSLAELLSDQNHHSGSPRSQ